MDNELKIFCICSGPLKTNAYVIFDSESKKCAIIDPALGSFDEIQRIVLENKLEPDLILLTHSHWDHIGDLFKLQKMYPIPILVHKEDVQNVENPGSDGIPYWVEIKGVKPTKLIQDDDEIALGSVIFKVIHTPGHSPGACCFYCEKASLLISGDTLFKGSIGSLSLPTSEPERMWKSLEKLKNLPKNTKIYPGHGGSTTVGDEGFLKDAKAYFG